jgi:hypothetical protein
VVGHKGFSGSTACTMGQTAGHAVHNGTNSRSCCAQ